MLQQGEAAGAAVQALQDYREIGNNLRILTVDTNLIYIEKIRVTFFHLSYSNFLLLHIFCFL